MKIGDIVIVVGCQSIPRAFLGSYVRVVGVFFQKVIVELNVSVGGRGSKRHTAFIADLMTLQDWDNPPQPTYDPKDDTEVDT